MQRDENLLYINNRQQIDAIHLGYGQTGAVYTRRSGTLEVTPDRTPIRPRTRIGSNSNVHIYQSLTFIIECSFIHLLLELELILILALIGVRFG